VELTVFDPDYDPDGTYAGEIVATVVAGLDSLHTEDPARAPDPTEASASA
jgi:arginase